MSTSHRMTAKLLLLGSAVALLCPAGAVAAPAGPAGLATCQAGRVLAKKTKRVRVTARDSRGRKRRVVRRKTTWACVDDRTAPGRVVGLVAVPGDGQAVLTWRASEDAGGIAGYEIYRDGQYVVTITDTTFTDPNLVNGVAHQYRVFAVDMARNLSRPSGVVWALPRAVPDVTPPGVPVGLTAAANPEALTVTVRWTAPLDDKGVTSYRIYRDGSLAGTSTTTEFVDAGREHKTEYKYTVVAFDAAGNQSAATPAVTTYVS